MILEPTLLTLATNRLRNQGGRMTTQRRLIIESLSECEDHPTAEDIFKRAHQQDNSLHLSTVYRTMRWLAEEGLVSPRWFDDEHHQERFDPVNPENIDHSHFRCRVCNQIFEFMNPGVETIKAAYQQQFGGHIESASLIFYGVCKTCEEK